ncbi:MAG TPA: phosphoribosylformylglycinamidine synthase subunit PurL [Candidatus Eisenbacteria bacterium]|nr:phosphoribosylformylglycinamidine synthase subunit PurL [Candidatus Eisenbacteria bacterium]
MPPTVDSTLLPFAEADASELKGLLAREGLRLAPGEVVRMLELLGRNPTRVEATIFDTMWSEHCSYKSSRRVLKAYLPTESPDVILGPGEDSGVVRFGTHEGVEYALVIAHESHNHPSQVVPVEGAATGVGGIVRDVNCMGAEVIGVLDALRFGDPEGPKATQVREIVRGVVDGIWQYGDPLGVPNLGGDVFFSGRYDENCLVNVVALGLVRADQVVRSRVPEAAYKEPYVTVLVGKPTDETGFGGASFASAILEEDAEGQRGHVQVPDPFLKRVLFEANRAALAWLHAQGAPFGFKDLGAGGIACVSSELAAAGGFGMDLDLDQVPTPEGEFPSEVLACSETQERFAFVVPERLAPRLLSIYNDDFALPLVYHRARAAVVGRVRTDGRYRILRGGQTVCDTPVEVITAGIQHDRPRRPRPAAPAESPLPPVRVDEHEALFRKLIASPNLASREPIVRYYDTEVQGRIVIRAGEADAGVLAPIPGSSLGAAITVDGNPWYVAAEPYWGTAHVVAESLRNLVAVGARPIALTDCLNFGNPEDPEVFDEFERSVHGLGDAARAFGPRGLDGPPVAIVSGNVSFYNESSTGRAIEPSPIVAALGVLDDYSVAASSGLKRAGSVVVLTGARQARLGASQLRHALTGETGGILPALDFDLERRRLYAVLEAVRQKLVLACHDIAEGGLAITAFEMALGGFASQGLGLQVPISSLGGTPAETRLYSEAPGFLMEVRKELLPRLLATFESAGVDATITGRVIEEPRLRILDGGATLLDIDLAEASRLHLDGIRSYVE